MPAFDKNSVQIEFAYDINPIEQDDTPVQPCPRCGCMAQRRHRSVCFSCKRRIPPMGARQQWEDKPKNPFEAVMPLVQREKASKEFKFGLTKKKDGKLLRYLRKAAPSIAVVVIALVATPYVVTSFLGEDEINQYKAQLISILNGQVAERDIASGTSHNQ